MLSTLPSNATALSVLSTMKIEIEQRLPLCGSLALSFRYDEQHPHGNGVLFSKLR